MEWTTEKYIQTLFAIFLCYILYKSFTEKTEEDKIPDDLLQYLDSKYELVLELSKSTLDFLNRSIILFKYEDWTHSYNYQINSKHFLIVLKTSVRLVKNGPDSENQLLLVLFLNFNSGKYNLTSTSAMNEITNFIFNDEPFDVENYNIVEIEKGQNIQQTKRLILVLDKIPSLEILIENNILIVKTRRKARLEDAETLNSLLNKLTNYLQD